MSLPSARSQYKAQIYKKYAFAKNLYFIIPGKNSDLFEKLTLHTLHFRNVTSFIEHIHLLI